MDPNASARTEESAGQSATHAEPSSDIGILADIQLLWEDLQGLSHDRFRLAALETRRAGQSLTTMLAAAVMLALLLSAAWLGLMAAGVQWLIEHDLQASSAILLAVAGNLLLALILFGVIRRRSRYLQFPATQHSLKPVSKDYAVKDLV
ncbi:phage holin family protein [Methylomonas sp. MO1]|uniref:phage holin family protein n=1 Tax=Methylomonas sp. MO1 TaxID=3073619 RepID=UPI0028A3A480|nr:phage holin family protein [Methylomonas sp. MO1]MDT4287956.1 phage holin family protein [Methylomonas sp. MO1]